MNILPLHKKVQVISLLVEGNSLRAASRISDVNIVTISRLLVDVGHACMEYHDQMARNIKSKRIQCDEIWSFVYSKEKNKPEGMENVGDVWTWTAIDADTKFVIGWHVGGRDAGSANDFMKNIQSRLANRIQMTADGHHSYVEAVSDHWGSQIDFAQLQKIYKPDSNGKGADKRYSPARCQGIKKKVISGNPDEDHISTSYVERQNLTMRMHMRRFTRLTNGFSKKLENHCCAIALHFVYYNFVKVHKTLRVTPAMEAKLTKRLMTIEDIVRLTPAPIASKRGKYKKVKPLNVVQNSKSE